MLCIATYPEHPVYPVKESAAPPEALLRASVCSVVGAVKSALSADMDSILRVLRVLRGERCSFGPKLHRVLYTANRRYLRRQKDISTQNIGEGAYVVCRESLTPMSISAGKSRVEDVGPRATKYEGRYGGMSEAGRLTGEVQGVDAAAGRAAPAGGDTGLHHDRHEGQDRMSREDTNELQRECPLRFFQRPVQELIAGASHVRMVCRLAGDGASGPCLSRSHTTG